MLNMTFTGQVQQSWLDSFDNWLEGEMPRENGSYRIDSGGALHAGAGYEIKRGRSLAVDLQARASTAFYRHIDERVTTLMLGVGLTWY
jgi:hypothetical protein